MTANCNLVGSGETYRVNLLQCWQDDVGEEVPWRFTLVGERTQKGFASPEDLTAFLQVDLSINQPDK
jgi:hypothetical protein